VTELPAFAFLVISVELAHELNVDEDESRKQSGLCLVRLKPMGLVRTWVSSLVVAVGGTECGAACDLPMEMRRGAPAGA
jgi:hypothetical protein